LVARSGVHLGQDFRVLTGANTIGKKTGIDISLADPAIQDQHLILTATRERGVISGFETARLICVNGKPLKGDQIIADSDVLRLNDVEFLVKWF
jgi:hypothetical protein